MIHFKRKFPWEVNIILTHTNISVIVMHRCKTYFIQSSIYRRRFYSVRPKRPRIQIEVDLFHYDLQKQTQVQNSNQTVFSFHTFEKKIRVESLIFQSCYHP